MEVYAVNEMTIRFRISNPKAREKVRKRGMWNIARVPMVVTKWTPQTEEEKQEENVIPMWVHLRKVPLHMYSWEGLSFMTNTVGFPDRLHPETLACSNLGVARVFVNVDVSKTLPNEIEFSKEGKEFTVEFHYPWLPARCSLCEKWGHTERVCVKNGKDKKRSEYLAGSGVKERQQKVPNGEGEKEILKEDESKEKEEEVKNNQEDNQGSNWKMVSPAKIGRSLPEHIPEVQISASKYYVLIVDDIEEVEEGEIGGDDQENNEDGDGGE